MHDVSKTLNSLFWVKIECRLEHMTRGERRTGIKYIGAIQLQILEILVAKPDATLQEMAEAVYGKNPKPYQISSTSRAFGFLVERGLIERIPATAVKWKINSKGSREYRRYVFSHS